MWPARLCLSIPCCECAVDATAAIQSHAQPSPQKPDDSTQKKKLRKVGTFRPLLFGCVSRPCRWVPLTWQLQSQPNSAASFPRLKRGCGKPRINFHMQGSFLPKNVVDLSWRRAGCHFVFTGRTMLRRLGGFLRRKPRKPSCHRFVMKPTSLRIKFEPEARGTRRQLGMLLSGSMGGSEERKLLMACSTFPRSGTL
jgi:hypothetical protein